MEQLVAAVKAAQNRGTADAGAIALILEQKVDVVNNARPQQLSDLPKAFAKVEVDLSQYSVTQFGGML